MSQDVPLDLGYSVETFDRRHVGVIEAIDEDRFLLRPRLRSPFWLTDGLVRSVDGGCVRLHVDSRVLGRYRQPATENARRRTLSRHFPPGPITGSFIVTALAAALWASF